MHGVSLLQSTNIQNQKDMVVRSRAFSHKPISQGQGKQPKNVYSIRGVINDKAGKVAKDENESYNLGIF